MIYLCASKGRPEAVKELIMGCYLYEMPEVAVMVGKPHSDYASVRWPKSWKIHLAESNEGLVKALNDLWGIYKDHDQIGVLNDRARPRENLWCSRLRESVGDGYANPQALGFNPRTNKPRLKNGIFNGALLREWGWIMPPWLTHLYTDDVLEDLLHEAGKFHQTDVMVDEQPMKKTPRLVDGIPFADRDRDAYFAWKEARENGQGQVREQV